LLNKNLEAVSDLENAVSVFLEAFYKINIPKQNWGGEETVPWTLEDRISVVPLFN
jgi:hypothetical protein